MRYPVLSTYHSTKKAENVFPARKRSGVSRWCGFDKHISVVATEWLLLIVAWNTVLTALSNVWKLFFTCIVEIVNPMVNLRFCLNYQEGQQLLVAPQFHWHHYLRRAQYHGKNPCCPAKKQFLKFSSVRTSLKFYILLFTMGKMTQKEKFRTLEIEKEIMIVKLIRRVQCLFYVK